jgi:Domain of unknown function (DUF4091)
MRLRRREWNRLARLAEALFLCAALPATGRGAEARVEVLSPLEQVFPERAPAGAAAARLEAARGEWEPFQMAVVAGNSPLEGVRAEASPLSGPVALAAPRMYRVGFLPVRTPSSVEGHAGAWPDALIPDVDAFAGEKRNAFPFDVPAREARAIWAEIWVPRSAPPGRYHGSITVRARGLERRLAVELEVHRLVLPATASLPVTFGITGNALAPAHHLDAGDGPRLLRLYALAALRHRISLHGGSLEPPPETNGEVDFAAYDAEVGPFLDGAADPGGPAEGARWTAIELRLPARLPDPARERYLGQVLEHFRRHGWLDRLFDYTFDEPNPSQFSSVLARAAFVHRLAPQIPRLVTRQLTPELSGAVDIWCPTVNYLDDRPENSSQPPRGAYEGTRLWWYQACMSHGCDIVGGDYFRGWPSLAVDAPAISHRILEWLTFTYRVGGELYYNTVEAYGAGRDPWRDQLLHGGNGDGTLFYPGRPDVIGGRSDIPVESIRLALIREGLEDYEYLRAFEARFGRAAAQAIARRVAHRTFEWNHDPRVLMEARHAIAVALDGATANSRP